MLKYKKTKKIKNHQIKRLFYYFQFYDYCMKEYLAKLLLPKIKFKNKSKMIRKPKSKKLITFISIQIS